GSRSPTASRGTSWRGRDGGLEQRDGGFKRGLPARPGALAIWAGAGEPRERGAPFRPGAGRGDQCISGARLLAAVGEAIVARRAHVFVGEVDAGNAGIVR